MKKAYTLVYIDEGSAGSGISTYQGELDAKSSKRYR
jgi:hypothetical protein